MKGRSGGRNSVPTELKLIRGNPGKRKINKSEPRPVPTAPPKPDWLTGEASAEWDYIVPELKSMGLLGRVDKATLTGYCLAWAQMRYTTEDNSGDSRRRGAMADIRAFSAQYGFSPADRSRMTTPEAPDGSKDAERLLS